jgi:hypothetical protein
MSALTDAPTRTTTARPTTPGEDLITVLAGFWLIVGLFLDGYAHQHLIAGTETFITPWHAVFYSGFAAASLWLGFLLARRPGSRIRDRIPPGYGAAVLGLVVFGLGGIGDGIWHTLLGVEVGIDALLSPTHLLLMLGMMAIVTAPYRAAIEAGTSRRRGVPLVSLGVAAALAAFFLSFVWGLGDGGFRVPYAPANGAGELAVIAGVASALVATMVFSTVVILALRLGSLRFGTFAVLFMLVAGAVHVAFEEEAVGVLAALIAGLVLDALLVGMSPHRRLKVALPASIAVLWSAYFVVPWSTGDIAWPAEIWSGTIVLATLTSAAMAYLTSASAARVLGSLEGASV